MSVPLCECGCGEPVKIHRGKPCRFVYGHAPRKSHHEYLVDANGCWIWQRAITGRGYGNTYVKVDGKRVSRPAHRVIYERLRGPIPVGAELDHLCRVRACVNPDHLEPVSHTVNVLRGTSPTALNARQTHCIHGHEFTAVNTYIRVRNGRPGRCCRECVRRRSAEQQRRRR